MKLHMDITSGVVVDDEVGGREVTKEEVGILSDIFHWPICGSTVNSQKKKCVYPV